MIHPFCAPSEQLQEASCFSNQASPRLLMTMISEAVHCLGTRSVLAAGWDGGRPAPPPRRWRRTTSHGRGCEPTQR